MSATDINAKEKSDTKEDNVLHSHCYVAGKVVTSDQILKVKSPYDNRLVGTVALANASHAQEAIEAALAGGKTLTRYERFSILEKTRSLLTERWDEFAKIISAESGLAIREAIYETGRAQDVLMFAAIESLERYSRCANHYRLAFASHHSIIR